LGTRSIRLEFDNNVIPSGNMLREEDLERMQQDKPLVGLLLSKEKNSPLPKRFLAQIVGIELLPAPDNGESTARKIAIELSFPEKFMQRQGDKIKQLLQVLE